MNWSCALLILWFNGKKAGKEYAVDGTKKACNRSGKNKGLSALYLL